MVIFAVSGLPSSADTPTPSPDAPASASPSPSPWREPTPEPTPDSTPEPLPPTPPPAPPGAAPSTPAPATIDPAYPGSLRPGDWVQIAGTDSCLNMRREPKIPSVLPDGTVYENVVNCLPDRFIGRLDAYAWDKTTVPVQADGHWWWHVLGQGWAAEDFLTLHHQGGIPWPERSDLANAGLVAFLGADNSVWLMNADGSDRRLFVAAQPNHWVQTLQWSPTGDQLAFTFNRPDGTLAMRVIDLNGNVATEVEGLSEPRWSPGGGHLSGVRVDQDSAAGYQSRPVVYDLATGGEWAIGPIAYYSAPVVWSPDGNHLAFVCESGYLGSPDGTSTLDEARNCHGDGLRISSIDGSAQRLLLADSDSNGYVSAPAWSPSGETIAVSSMLAGGCIGYTLINVVSGANTGCITPPGMGTFSGGQCGGPGMSNSTWTRDGRLVYASQGTGQSGIFVHDVVGGTTTFTPSMWTARTSLSSDGVNFMFDSGGHIWVAGLDGSNLTLLAEGHSPAWQPQP